MYNRIQTNSWDFKNSNTKEYTHGYHSYPAMMIPQIARKLINDYKPNGNSKILFDPYMGSGTSLVEGMLCGMECIGTDINPLARLIATVKTTIYPIEEIENTTAELFNFIKNYSADKVINTNFNHITSYDYWYSNKTLLELSYITQLIENVEESIRDFFKLALAEVVREASFTRNGEFKRFRMPETKIATFDPDTFKLFINKLKKNIQGLKSFANDCLVNKVRICDFNTVSGISEDFLKSSSVDIVVTSPPYGDSRTTVAYGQFSRWANEWFNFENAKNLDTLLMGGKKNTLRNFSSGTIEKELNEIHNLDEKRYYEVISFLNDYSSSINNVANVIRPGGRICYVVGNRTVKGVQIPLDYFTAEMFEANGFIHDSTIVRSIPNKRMPSKTSPTNIAGSKVSTMTSEYIVIMTKQ